MVRFDDQADRFDERAGLPEDVCRRIADGVRALGRVEPEDVVLEIGAGTGQIGGWIKPARYVGMDASVVMIRVFQRGLSAGRGTHSLLHADGNAGWPVADGTVRAIFSSRAIHWLDMEHVVDEVFRVAAPDGAALLIGRVRRRPDSVSVLMRREMRSLLRHRGIAGRGGEENRDRIIQACCALGATAIAPVRVGNWAVAESPRRSIESWEQVEGLAGADVPPAVKREVLEELRGYAAQRFGTIDAVVPSEETYVLEGVRITP